jgi:hypothetical protein
MRSRMGEWRRESERLGVLVGWWEDIKGDSDFNASGNSREP